MEREITDLLGLQSRLKEGVERLFPSKVWLKAEVVSVKSRPGGHCYLELAQSGESGMVAKAQAVIWASKNRLIAPYFESVAGSPLSEGMSVLIQVRVTYSQLYGLALSVEDIDPAFSLGELESRRLRTMERLRAEGLVDMQKSLGLPFLPQRFAVVSAPDAAGYRDFMRHLHENPYGFVFETTLFAALMQGAEAPSSISAALDDVAAASDAEGYDAVLILRGGGSRTDLACYDDYGLCARIAQFPIPVLTAVGHDQDHHACDEVAWAYLKTPTALADEILGWYADEDARLSALASRLRTALSSGLHRHENRLEMLRAGIRGGIAARLSAMENTVNLLEARIRGADPRRMLGCGYVLAADATGRVLRSAACVAAGDKVSVVFADGRAECRVEKTVASGQAGGAAEAAGSLKI